MATRIAALSLMAKFRQGYAESRRNGWDFGMDYYRIEFFAVYRALREEATR